METIIQRFNITTNQGTYFFNPYEIVRLEAKSNYTYIFLANGGKIFTSRVLKQLASHLEPMGFLRTHRTHLINPDHVTQLRSNGTILMSDDSIAEVSRRMQSCVKKKLKEKGN